MTNATQGRRPTGPGLYRYTGSDPFYGFRPGAHQHNGTICEVYDNGDVSFMGRNGNHVDAYSGDFVPLSPPVVCNDGFSLSVQAGQYLYSAPRTDYAKYYTEVEVGFPSEREELLIPYAEDASKPTETVYGYVPIEVIEAVIEKHGGIDVNATGGTQ